MALVASWQILEGLVPPFNRRLTGALHSLLNGEGKLCPEDLVDKILSSRDNRATGADTNEIVEAQAEKIFFGWSHPNTQGL